MYSIDFQAGLPTDYVIAVYSLRLYRSLRLYSFLHVCASHQTSMHRNGKCVCFFFTLFQISMFFVHSFSLSFFIYILRVHARNVPKMPCRWHYKWEANPWVLMAVTTKSHVTVPGRRTMQRSSVSDRLIRMVGSNVMWELRT